MTIKLPIILSAMIAALSVPGTLASQAEAKPEAAAPATDATAAPTAEEKKPAAKMDKKEGHKHSHKGKRHHHKDSNSPKGGYDGSYDDGQLTSVDGDPTEDRSPPAKKGDGYVHPGEYVPSKK